MHPDLQLRRSFAPGYLDLKPDAPREIRGEFKPIATCVPGISITEHLPRLAALAHRYAIIRSVTHRDNDHAIGAYLALTGYSHPKNAILGIEPPARRRRICRRSGR